MAGKALSYTMKQYLIQCKTADSDGEILFWNNDFGWVEKSEATFFNYEDVKDPFLFIDGVVVEAE